MSETRVTTVPVMWGRDVKQKSSSKLTKDGLRLER